MQWLLEVVMAATLVNKTTFSGIFVESLQKLFSNSSEKGAGSKNEDTSSFDKSSIPTPAPKPSGSRKDEDNINKFGPRSNHALDRTAALRTFVSPLASVQNALLSSEHLGARSERAEAASVSYAKHLTSLRPRPSASNEEAVKFSEKASKQQRSEAFEQYAAPVVLAVNARIPGAQIGNPQGFGPVERSNTETSYNENFNTPEAPKTPGFSR
jgi:hypothetical protein